MSELHYSGSSYLPPKDIRIPKKVYRYAKTRIPKKLHKCAKTRMPKKNFIGTPKQAYPIMLLDYLYHTIIHCNKLLSYSQRDGVPVLFTTRDCDIRVVRVWASWTAQCLLSLWGSTSLTVCCLLPKFSGNYICTDAAACG